MTGVAGRALLIDTQLGLHLSERLLGHDRRDWHLDPLLLRPRGMGDARPGRQQRRFAPAGRRRPGAIGHRPAGIGRVAQDAAHAGHGPPRLARRGRHPQPGQPRRELIQGCRRLQVPVEQLRDQHRLLRLYPDRGRVPGPVQVQAVAERRPSPRQQRARPKPGVPAAPHPLSDQRALVLGHRPADLQQQLIMRVIAHRPVQELHLAAMASQLLDQQHLVDVVPGQPVRRGHQDNVEVGQRCMIPQPIHSRPAKLAPL